MRDVKRDRRRTFVISFLLSVYEQFYIVYERIDLNLDMRSSTYEPDSINRQKENGKKKTM